MKKLKNSSTGKLEVVTSIARTTSKWDPNKFTGGVLSLTKPLLDNSNTPRGAKKAFTLERVFDRDVWVYNKSGLGDFKEAAKDQKRGKTIGKMIRKKKRQSMSRSKSKSPRGTGYQSR
jgi:hypothetical protein